MGEIEPLSETKPPFTFIRALVTCKYILHNKQNSMRLISLFFAMSLRPDDIILIWENTFTLFRQHNIDARSSQARDGRTDSFKRKRQREEKTQVHRSCSIYLFYYFELELLLGCNGWKKKRKEIKLCFTNSVSDIFSLSVICQSWTE